MKIQSEKYKKERNQLLDINYEFVWLHIYIYDFFHQNEILNNDDTKCLTGYYLCDAPVKKITDEFRSGMKIFIKTIDDKILTLEMRHSNKIRDIKMKIEEKTKLSVDEQSLIFQGEILNDDNKTIREYQIFDLSEIIIVGRLRGGTENCFPASEMFKDEEKFKEKSMFAKTAEQKCEIPKHKMQERPRLFYQNETIDEYGICEKPMRRTRISDTRRWSLASLSSSGYGTLTPTSSNLSSQYSSKENLIHHKHHCSQQPRSPLCIGGTAQSSPFHTSAVGISSVQSSLRCGSVMTAKCISGRNSRNHSPHDKLNSENHRTPTDSTTDAQSATKNLLINIKQRSHSLKYKIKQSDDERAISYDDIRFCANSSIKDSVTRYNDLIEMATKSDIKIQVNKTQHLDKLQDEIFFDNKKIEYQICMRCSLIDMVPTSKNENPILIKISNKSIIPISIDPRSKIFDLKLKIEKQTGIQFVGINLIYRNKVLDDEKSLIDYNIEDGCVVSVDDREFFSFMQAIKSGLFESVQNFYNDKFYEMQIECKPSPLHYACKQHNADIVKFLIRKKFKVNSFDNEYNMPIHYACINNHVEILKTLIENKCDIEVCNAYGMRPIHLACLSGNFGNVKLLIENGCKLESKDYLGRQPIHLACLAGNIDIVKLLIQNESKIDVIDKTNKSPLIIAENENHTEIKEIINEEILSRRMIENMIKALDLKCENICDHKFCPTSLRSKSFYKGKKIGHGSFGTIYLSQISQSSRQIVIKKISKSEISSDLIEGNINKFIDKINHKRIIKYFGAIRKDENSFIFMEFMPGGSLRSQISKNPPMASNKVSQYTMQILEGLHFLHSKKIIHRDIKPDHILLDKYYENVKLSDLGMGISFYNRCNFTTDTICGTINYMAPEVINGEYYSCAVDIWSLGITILEMLTGRLPYHELVHEAVLFKIGTTRKIPYQLPESSAKEMKELIDQMLIPEPSRRPTAMDLMNRMIHFNET